MAYTEFSNTICGLLTGMLTGIQSQVALLVLTSVNAIAEQKFNPDKFHSLWILCVENGLTSCADYCAWILCVDYCVWTLCVDTVCELLCVATLGGCAVCIPVCKSLGGYSV